MRAHNLNFRTVTVPALEWAHEEFRIDTMQDCRDLATERSPCIVKLYTKNPNRTKELRCTFKCFDGFKRFLSSSHDV